MTQANRIIHATMPLANLATDEMYAEMFGIEEDADSYDDQCDLMYERNREEEREVK